MVIADKWDITRCMRMIGAWRITGMVIGVGIGLLLVFGIQWAQEEATDILPLQSSSITTEHTQMNWTLAMLAGAVIGGIVGLIISSWFDS